MAVIKLAGEFTPLFAAWRDHQGKSRRSELAVWLAAPGVQYNVQAVVKDWSTLRAACGSILRQF